MKKFFLFLVLCFVGVMEGRGQQVYAKIRLVEYYTPESKVILNFGTHTTSGLYWWNGGTAGFGQNPADHCWGTGVSPGTHSTDQTVFNAQALVGYNLSITIRSFFDHNKGTTCNACQNACASNNNCGGPGCNSAVESESERYQHYDANNTLALNLFQYAVGVESPDIFLFPASNGVWVKIRVTLYTPPAPNIAFNPAITANRFCPDQSITLSASLPTTPVGINPNMYQGLQYKWEYLIELDPVLVPNPDWTHCFGRCVDGYYPIIPPIELGGSPTLGDFVPPLGDSIFCYQHCANIPTHITTYPTPQWKFFSASFNTATINFEPQNVFITNQLFNKARNVRFRCKVYNPNITNIGSFYSTEMLGTLLMEAPRFPENLNLNEILTTPSCPNGASGKVTVKNISKLSANKEYRYILREGQNTAPISEAFLTLFLDNNPNNDPPGLSVVKSGIDSTVRDLVITGLAGSAQGKQYTLLILNMGNTEGGCYNHKFIDVPNYPVLTIPADSVTFQNPTCFGGNGGSIQITPLGGKSWQGDTLKYEPLQVIPYDAPNSPTLGTATKVGRKITYTGLKAGTHTILVRDSCGQMKQQEVTIKHPPKTKAILTQLTQPTCNNVSNGYVEIEEKTDVAINPPNLNPNFLLNRSDSIAYEVYRDGALQPALSNPNRALPADRKFLIQNLSSGTYEVKIRNHATPVSCVSDTAKITFVINTMPNIPTMTVTDTTQVKCKNETNGKFTFSGYSASYEYKLYKITENVFTTLNSGSVEGLKAGQYRVIAKRLTPLGCLDSTYTHVITITEPNLLAVTATKTDITCNNLNNGKITGTIAGGTTGYKLFVEDFYNGSWATVPGKTQNNAPASFEVSDLEAGEYRIRIKDFNDCEVISQSYTIINPAELKINTPIREDIKCFGEMGRIIISPTGGTSTITHEYTTDGTTYTAFTNTTPLPTGSYTVRVKDVNNCISNYATPLVITAPAQALDYSYTLSNYNGFEISCFGANTGFVNLTAIGGNSASYTGYNYSLNGGAFKPFEAVVDSLFAGNYMLVLKDARGCEVSKSFVLTQPAGALSATTGNVQNLACPSIPTGSFEVYPSQGTSPYQYSKDNGATFQSSAAFGQLFMGTYNVIVKDANDCRTTTSATVGSIFPVIVINHTQTNISCFQGNDGTINVSPVGGNNTYTYAWQGRTEITATLSGLAKGTYKVTVTDGTGCSETKEITLTQPAAPLKLVQKTLPVCFGQTNGSITFSATGGTRPYQYSIDGGANYLADSAFVVSAGTYSLKIRDIKLCTDIGATVVETRNILPKPSFLISTRTNALDTLMIKEISVPKPDTLFWEFPPQATVIDANPWSPLIKFPADGTYPVKMTGEFAGCFYSITKDLVIKPYDPNATNVLPTGTRMLKSLLVSPNPNDGTFNYKVEVAKKRKVVVTLINTMGQTVYTKEWDNELLIDENVTLPASVPSGLYVLRVITDIDARQQSVSVSR